MIPAVLIPLVLKLIDGMIPVVLDAAVRHKAATGKDATPADIRAMLTKNVAETVQEADQWLAEHPKSGG